MIIILLNEKAFMNKKMNLLYILTLSTLISAQIPQEKGKDDSGNSTGVAQQIESGKKANNKSVAKAMAKLSNISKEAHAKAIEHILEKSKALAHEIVILESQQCSESDKTCLKWLNIEKHIASKKAALYEAEYSACYNSHVLEKLADMFDDSEQANQNEALKSIQELVAQSVLLVHTLTQEIKELQEARFMLK
jgi:cell pole-organizing protein PopZ